MTAGEIVERWSNEAERLALLFAGQPDERVEAALAEFGARVLAGFANLVDDADPAELGEIVDAVVDEIRTRRREIEGGSQAQSAPA